jgi:hypothetical protein
MEKTESKTKNPSGTLEIEVDVDKKDRRSRKLNVTKNVSELEEPLYRAWDLVQFYAERFRENMSHDKSVEIRERLREVRTALIDNLEELYGILRTIDPDITFEWILGYVEDDDEDPELN